MYVFHILILSWLLQLVPALPNAPGYVAKPAAIVCCLFVSFAAAWLSYHLYEKHFLRLKRFFEYARPVRDGVAATVPAFAAPQ
jgi:peptidoglycan/LPS O-acetylase OafA/YrhL